VDYARVRTYDTEWKAAYDPEYMPYWKEVLESSIDPSVREVWVWKCTRCGGSENALLTVLRYHVAALPVPLLYVGGQQQSVERFMELRIKAGFALSDATEAAYRAARVREHEIMFPCMDMLCTWPTNKQAFKQSGYALVLADEVSSWPECSTELLRERVASYAFPHIIGVSSSDAQKKQKSEDDPIITEWEKTDRREWMCRDPVTGNPFIFRLGGTDTMDGVKWDSGAKRTSGEWDYARVVSSAHYITPDGTRIDELDRMKTVRTGQWVSSSDTGMPGRRGYRVTRFMVPFSVGSFGHIASAFLEAKRSGPRMMRTFVFEYLAEKWLDVIETPRDDAMDARILSYAKGEDFAKTEVIKQMYIGKPKTTFLTADVQKTHVWWLVREWIQGGDSGLLEYGTAALWEEIEAIGNRYQVHQIWVDNSYAQRAQEVMEEAYFRRMIPCYGRDQLELPFMLRLIDPFEGKRGGGRDKIGTYTWKPNVFKDLLFDMIKGESERRWYVYEAIEREYVRQMIAEERDPEGWHVRKGFTANHLWDCEVMQLLAATVNQIHRLPG